MLHDADVSEIISNNKMRFFFQSPKCNVYKAFNILLFPSFTNANDSLSEHSIGGNVNCLCLDILTNSVGISCNLL
jgi:hypothetical protein